MRIDTTHISSKVAPQEKKGDTSHAHLAAGKFTELLNQVGEGTKPGIYKVSAFQMSSSMGENIQKDERGGILV
jgi:hypothetical protein